MGECRCQVCEEARRRIEREYERLAQKIEAPERPLLSLYDAIGIAQEGFRRWAEKPHNRRWARKIDGTPIPNDLTCTIAEAFADAMRAHTTRAFPPRAEGE